MTSSLGLLLKAPVLSVALFVVLFGLFVLLFCRPAIGRFLGGMLQLAAALVVAPVRYLQAAALRVIEYSKATRDYREDRQYLIRTVLLMSNAFILLVAIGLLAAGAAGAWRALCPGEVREARVQARSALPDIEQRVAELEKQAAEVQGKLGAQTPEEKEAADLNQRAQAASQAVKASRKTLDINPTPTWTAVRQYLDMNGRATADYELSRVQNDADGYVRRMLRPEAAAPVLQFIQDWVGARRLQREASLADRRNPRAALLREKARVEDSLSAQKQRLQQTRERLTALWLLRQLQPMVALAAVLGTIVGTLVFVWLAGLAVEWIGLLVDAATNIRAIRRVAETPRRAEAVSTIAQTVETTS
jgi:hypothetical protein